MSKGAMFLSTATGKGYAVVETGSILYLTATPDLTWLFTTEGVVAATLPMDYFEATLSPLFFCRIHEAHIVALDQIISFDPSGILLPGALLPIGKSYLSHLCASLPILEETGWFINREGKLEQGTGELQ
jgi:DNA-binding LytR/AlgR family response regulator